MARTRSTTRNRDQDDDTSSRRKRFRTSDNGGAGRWADLNHHLLYLVMMQLGVVDYISFSRVCKSWWSLALPNRNTFMASKPPMTMGICWYGTAIKTCYLEDFEKRKIKTTLPFASGAYVGLTCGYLIFFRKTTREFLLVNPITRQNLNFSDIPKDLSYIIDSCGTRIFRAILVFSHTIGKCVLLVTHDSSNQIWFSTEGKGAWNHVSCTSFFTDLCAFKGKIYTLCDPRSNLSELYELRLNPEPKLTLLETKNSLKTSHISKLVSSREHLYVMDLIPLNKNLHMRHLIPNYQYRFQELDFGDMKWVSREKTVGESASFLSDLRHGVAVNPELSESRRKGLLLGHNDGDVLKPIEVAKASPFSVTMWYFPHESSNVDHIE